MSDRVGVLFVCMGNICRSPLARVAFEWHADRRGVRDRFEIDSCGTGGWHAGEGADPRAVQTARKNGIDLVHTARQYAGTSDVRRFEWLIAMDRTNARNLVAAGAPRERVHLLRSFDPSLRGLKEDALEVPDPYYGSERGFDEVFTMVNAACAGLLEFLLDRE
jgi:protein-tyrosine phosphatase